MVSFELVMNSKHLCMFIIGSLNDLWNYNPSTNQWTWMSGNDTLDQVGVFGAQGTPSSTNLPSGRGSSVSWTDSNGKLWLFGGSTSSGKLR